MNPEVSLRGRRLAPSWREQVLSTLLNLPLLFEERIYDDVSLCGLVTLGPCALSCVEDGSSRKCRSSLLSSWRTETIRVRLESATCQ